MPKRSTDVTVSKGRLERMPRPAGALRDIDRLFEDFFGRWPRGLLELRLPKREQARRRTIAIS